MNIDLTRYVITRASRGPWLTTADALTPNELRLTDARDLVTLAGPLRVCVAVQALNRFAMLGSNELAVQARDVYSYTLDIPPGQTWSYPSPKTIETRFHPELTTLAPSFAATLAARESQPLMDATGAVVEGVNPPATRANLDAAMLRPDVLNDRLIEATLVGREAWLGANSGFGVVIRPVGLCADPCVTDVCRTPDPCPPRGKDCHCGQDPCRCGGHKSGCGGGSSCGCGGHKSKGGGCGCGGACGCGGGQKCGCECGGDDDLPCDFATGRGGHAGHFFPAACEPCAPGAFVGMPPVKGPSLTVPPARGGTVRTRYFNGMFITKEDLWTDQNNNRIKHALMNRAMGQGVVWGLNVGLDGDGICVLPGYGVDCCGNDIVLSSPYRVDASALVRDPAAAAVLSKGRQHRMNLLLEYFECPEEPRPVHGDPCAPEHTSCEMSRIRETARLRLVPPCDVDDSGPIKDFLEEIRKLKGDSVIGPLFPAQPTPTPAPVSGPTTTTTSAPATSVPFQIVVKSVRAGVLSSKTINPKLGLELVNLDSDVAEKVVFELHVITGAQFDGGRVRELQPNPATLVATIAPLGSTWSVPQVPLSAPSNPLRIVDQVDWKLSQGNTVFEGRTRLTLTRFRGETTSNVVRIEFDHEGKQTTTIVVQPPPVQPPRFPCSAEACDPDGRPRFPVPLPWLHADPRHPDQAADPKVIVLAILYALVVSKIAQSSPNDAQVQAEIEKLAATIHTAGWKLFYDEVPNDRRADLMEALRRLLQAWCKVLLYPGPRCECGCDPHGVVIGCAVVEGGTIRVVDPWGGRRWVVHYPLLAYWGKQFGIQPLDAIASKFFDLICCVAKLYPSNRDTRFPLAPFGHFANVRPPIVELGGSALVFDQPANMSERLSELGVAPDRTVDIGPMEFLSRVIGTLNAPGGDAPSGVGSVLFRVAGVPELNFVVRGREEGSRRDAPAGSAATPSAPAQPARPASSGRLSTAIRAAIMARPPRSAVPPLLRDVTEAITRELLDATGPEPTTDAGRDVRDLLTTAGITSVAGLLDANPEDLHVDVLNRGNAAGLADLLTVSEGAVTSTVKAVADTVAKFAADRRLVSRENLREARVANAFIEGLRGAVRGLPADAVKGAVERAAGRR